jgi:ABC-type dipeptide/oligopeptide/nickel transport system permease component
VAVYVCKRLVWGSVLFVVLTFVTYVIFFVVPHNEGAVAGRTAVTGDLRQAFNAHGGVFQEYWDFLTGILRHGALGSSVANGRSVDSILARCSGSRSPSRSASSRRSVRGRSSTASG